MRSAGTTKIALLLISLVILGATYSELYPYYDLNDTSLHQIPAQMMADRITSGKNPIDFYVPYWSCGYPLFAQYQFLPHLALAVLYLLGLKLIPIHFLHHLMIILLMAAYPWVFYRCLRRLGLKERQALFGALLSLFFRSSIGFGQEFASYVMYGSGLFTQVFGMLVFPWALANGYELISGKTKRLFLPVLSVGLLFLSHVFLAYLLMLILGFWWLLGLQGSRAAGLARMISLVLLAVVVAGFFIFPMVANSAYHAFSRYEPLTKTSSYGAIWVFTHLFNGDLFDAHRYPAMTLLVGIGLLLALRKKTASLLVATGFIVATLLFFGRPTWGGWLDFLPMAKDVHFERFILGLHFFGAALAGIAVSWWIDRALALKSKILTAPILAALLAVLLVIGAGTYAYLKDNRAMIRVLAWNYEKDLAAEKKLFGALKRMDTGRVFAGTRGGWGKDYKLSGVSLYFIAGYERLPVIGHLPFGWSPAGDFSVLLNDRNPVHQDLFNITHIISWPNDTYWSSTPVYFDSRTSVYRTGAKGYFDVVRTPFALRADKYTFWNPVVRWFKSGLVSEKAFVRLCFKDGECDPAKYERYLEMSDAQHMELHERDDESGLTIKHRGVFDSESPYGASPIGFPGSVISESQPTDSSYKARVKANDAAVAMLKVTFHPFWRAKVNGVKVKPFMVSPGFLAVNVPAGESDVEFYYRTAWWKWALLLVSIAVLFVLFRSSRKPDDPASTGAIEPMHSGGTILFSIAVVSALMLLTLKLALQSTVPLDEVLPVGVELKASDLRKPLGRISIDGIPFDTGVKMPFKGATFVQRLYRLQGNYRSFEAWAGMSDDSWSCGDKGKASFDVWVDEVKVYSSSVLSPGQRPRYVKLDLTGKKYLKLVVSSMEEKPCGVPAWAGASLSK
jgi:NPCBM/NEW2 domain/Bacterial membrane protein YfhO